MRTEHDTTSRPAATAGPLLPEPSPEVIFKRVTDGAVLLSTEDEVYFGLNDVGARIWELLEAHATLDELAGALNKIYPDVEPATVRADAAELVDQLLENGLLKVREQRG